MASSNRREFLKTAVGGMGYLACSGRPAWGQAGNGEQVERPNILWISTEDISPDLGCYGDEYAITPNLDKLAAQSLRYANAFTHAGVCAPVRTGIITGMYPSTIGTCPMRCKGVPQPEVKCFTHYLRAAGYYTSNRVKTDYQFAAPETAWDDCSKKGHWRNRAAGQPFFSVINLTVTHESQIRSPKGKKAQLHDPKKAVVPPYYPDTPVVRNDLACYADNVTKMDRMMAEILDQLEADGLAENTIVWFWGDHGRGLPRCKRWVYDSGMRIPLLIRVPEKYRQWVSPGAPEAVTPGTVTERMVSSVDFGPTVLSLAGVPLPKHMQGKAFLGPRQAPPREYVFGVRDRIDEAFDLVRSVHSRRWGYVRNFMPHVPYSVDIAYMNEMPTMQEMRRLHAEGKLRGAENQYFRYPRYVEELYDKQRDPYEVTNLAGRPEAREVLLKMRRQLRDWMKSTRDIGLIPEPDFDVIKRPGDVYERAAEPAIRAAKGPGSGMVTVRLTCGTEGALLAYRVAGKAGKAWQYYTQPIRVPVGTLLEVKAERIGFRDSAVIRYRAGDRPPVPKNGRVNRPHWSRQIDDELLERLLAVKDLDFAGRQAIPDYLKALDDPYGPVRYWAIVGLHFHCKSTQEKQTAAKVVSRYLKDVSPSARIAAAHALCDWGQEAQGLKVLSEMLEHEVGSVRHFAMTALQYLGERARPLQSQIERHLQDENNYVVRTTKHVLHNLGVTV